MGAYLTSPKTDKHSEDGGDLTFEPSRYGLSCMQGWRKNMEDSHICYSDLKVQEIEESISIYGVFDGHGGPNVSRWISYSFLSVFLKCLNEATIKLKDKKEELSDTYKLQLIKLTLEKTFLKLDEEMLLTENQEKLRKFSASSSQEEDNELKEGNLYSILNSIVTKNMYVKAVDKDGKRCLQVMYNDDGLHSREENAEEDPSALTNSTECSFLLEENSNIESTKNVTPSQGANLSDESLPTPVSAEEALRTEENNREEKRDVTKEVKNEVGVNSKKEDVKEEAKETVVSTSCTKEGGDANTLECSIKEESKEEETKELTKSSNDDRTTNAKRLKKDMNINEGAQENNSCKESKNRLQEDTTTCSETEPNEKEKKVTMEVTFDALEAKEKLEKNADTTVSAEVEEEEEEEEPEELDMWFQGDSSKMEESKSGFKQTDNANECYLDSIYYELDDEDDVDNEERERERQRQRECVLEKVKEGDEGMYSRNVIDELLNVSPRNNVAFSCGSTALVAVILKGYVIVANAGDSRAIVCFSGNSLCMSTDHKPHLPEEEQRIRRAGGFISNGRVDGNLNLTRAIGDLNYKRDPFLPQKNQKISAFPEITCATLTPDDEFLFLACDGIWDCKEGSDIVTFVNTRLEKFVEKAVGEEGKETAVEIEGMIATSNTDVKKEENKITKEIEEDNSKAREDTNTALNEKKEENEGKEKKEESQELPAEKEQRETIEKKEQNALDEIKKENEENNNNNTKIEEETCIKENNSEEKNLEASQMNGPNMSIGSDSVGDKVLIEKKKHDTFNKLSQICEELCDDCLSNGFTENDGIGCDNMTCLLVQYNPLYKTQTEKKFIMLEDL